jgi:hypothetical protein
MKWLIAVAVGLGLLFPAISDARTVRKVRWAGDTWTVRHTYGASNPGRNIFSDSKKSVWVDSKKRLNLRIRKGRAVEIAGKRRNYGTFTWSVASNLTYLDSWRVVGLFVWLPNGNEQDIEFARWGAPNAPTGWTVGWFYHTRANFTNFVVTPYAPYTVKLTWTPISTHYSMTDAHGSSLMDVTYTHPLPYADSVFGFQPRMSHWLWPGVKGSRLTESRKRNTDAVLRINSFSYSPLR